MGSPQTLSEADRRLVAAWAADCAERLADYKVPRRIETADELPRNATGKVLKGQLQEGLRRG